MTIVCALLSLFDIKVGVTNLVRVWTERAVRPEAAAAQASTFHTVWADRVLSVGPTLAQWRVPSSCEVFAFSFITFILGALALGSADRANGTSCRLAISIDVQKLSVKRRLFNNIAFKVRARGPGGHYRAITSESLVWTSGGKLMCCCDESVSLIGPQWERDR